MLNHLVLELFLEVIFHVAPSDLRALRLVSRHVEHQTRASFAVAFFSTLKLDFSEPNLQWLASIASHPDFRHAVRGMELGHWAPNWGRDEEFALGYGGYWPRLPGGPVDPSSKLAQQFTSAVRRLPGCTRVSITDVKTQSGPPQAGVDIGPGCARLLSPLDAIELTLYAYSLPGAPPLRDLHIRVTNRPFYAARKAISSSTIDAVLPNWAANAEGLLLEFMPEDQGMPLLLRLLTAATGLKSLRLTWAAPEENYRSAYGMEYVIWRDNLGGSLLSLYIRDSPEYSPLETLALRGITTNEADLLVVLSRCRHTLTSLSFSNMGLSAGTWTSVLKHLRASAFPNLRSLSMYMCTQREGRGAVGFCNLLESREAAGPNGGTFDFATGASFRMRLHVIGVLFQSWGASTFEAGLRAIVDRCRVLPYEDRGSGRCEALVGVPTFPADGHAGPLSARQWWITTGERERGVGRVHETGASPSRRSVRRLNLPPIGDTPLTLSRISAPHFDNQHPAGSRGT